MYVGMYICYNMLCIYVCISCYVLCYIYFEIAYLIKDHDQTLTLKDRLLLKIKCLRNRGAQFIDHGCMKESLSHEAT